MRRLTFFLLACTMLLLLCRPAQAHSMYQSSVLLDFHSGSVGAELQLPTSRLSGVMNLPLTEQSLPSVEPAVRDYILQRFSIRSKSSHEWQKALTAPPSWQIIDGAPYIVVHLHLTPPAGTSLRQLILEDDVITDTLPSHAVLVSIRSDWNSSTFANDPELLGILSGGERTIDVSRDTGGWTKGFGSIFHLGIRHIAEGTDHLLFLLALLLPAPVLLKNKRWAGFAGVRHGFVQILKVVSAFTVGHSRKPRPSRREPRQPSQPQKRRELSLGGRRVSAERFAEIGAAARQVRSQKASQARSEILPIITHIQTEGATTLRAIAAQLNAREIEAPRGGQWATVQVQRLLN